MHAREEAVVRVTKASAATAAAHERHDSGLAQAGRFLRHLVEMILAMMVGMAIWGAILSLLLAPAGYGAGVRAFPELNFGLMSGFMAVPMVVWMRYRGHSWERSAEMVGAMLVLPAGVFLCTRLGLGAHIPWFTNQAVFGSAHDAMYLGMLLLMLYRRRDYTHAGPHGAHAAASAAGVS